MIQHFHFDYWMIYWLTLIDWLIDWYKLIDWFINEPTEGIYCLIDTQWFNSLTILKCLTENQTLELKSSLNNSESTILKNYFIPNWQGNSIEHDIDIDWLIDWYWLIDWFRATFYFFIS